MNLDKPNRTHPLRHVMLLWLLIIMMAGGTAAYWSSHYYAIDPKHPVMSAVNYNDVPPASTGDANQPFRDYIVEHKCLRESQINGVLYRCDNGVWFEEDFLKVVEGDYPYKGGRK